MKVGALVLLAGGSLVNGFAPLATSSSKTSALYSTTEERVATEADLEQAQNAALSKLEKAVNIPELLQPLQHFIKEYMTANFKSYQAGNEEAAPPQAAQRILECIDFGMRFGLSPDSKYTFDVTHQALRGQGRNEYDTRDYYQFGCDFFRPCMNLDESVVLGEEYLKEAFDRVKQGENVVFFANHQSEADPQVFSCLLEKVGLGQEASEVVYVAGHKVTTDPLAIPFSMGRNLLCIHSKKHIDADPETKPKKQRQNMATMSAMLKMFKADEGVALWVAPSGGRDRRDVDTGDVPIADFDSKTIDMFRLMGNKSKKPTWYYPLAMVSYNLCPPPDTTEAAVGEERNVRFVPIGIACGPAVLSEGGLEKRHVFCNAAQESCQEGYEDLLEQIEH